MRRVALIATGTAVLALIAAPNASAVTRSGGARTAGPAPCMGALGPAMRSGAFETVALRTYNVVVKPEKKVYKIGETATIHATVTRPAHEDPAGLGQRFDPPQSFPAEEVNVGIGLRIGDVFLFGFGITNADGKSDIKVKIAPYTPPGKAIADAFAWKRQAETPCLNVEENGYTFVPGIFRVER